MLAQASPNINAMAPPMSVSVVDKLPKSSSGRLRRDTDVQCACSTGYASARCP